MLLNITGTSAKVKDLLTEAQINRSKGNKNAWTNIQVIIQSDSATTEEVYISFGEDAVVGESLELLVWATLSFDEVDIADINIISKTGANTVIIEFN